MGRKEGRDTAVLQMQLKGGNNKLQREKYKKRMERVLQQVTMNKTKEKRDLIHDRNDVSLNTLYMCWISIIIGLKVCVWKKATQAQRPACSWYAHLPSRGKGARSIRWLCDRMYVRLALFEPYQVLNCTSSRLTICKKRYGSLVICQRSAPLSHTSFISLHLLVAHLINA